MTDMVNHPPHYTSHPSNVEVIEITRWCSFNIGNAIKYLMRHGNKGAAEEDLNKALWYLRDADSRVYSYETSFVFPESAKWYMYEVINSEIARPTFASEVTNVLFALYSDDLSAAIDLLNEYLAGS